MIGELGEEVGITPEFGDESAAELVGLVDAEVFLEHADELFPVLESVALAPGEELAPVINGGLEIAELVREGTELAEEFVAATRHVVGLFHRLVGLAILSGGAMDAGEGLGIKAVEGMSRGEFSVAIAHPLEEVMGLGHGELGVELLAALEGIGLALEQVELHFQGLLGLAGFDESGGELLDDAAFPEDVGLAVGALPDLDLFAGTTLALVDFREGVEGRERGIGLGGEILQFAHGFILESELEARRGAPRAVVVGIAGIDLDEGGKVPHHQGGAFVLLGEEQEHFLDLDDGFAGFFVGEVQLLVALLVVLQFESPPRRAVAALGRGGLLGRLLDLLVVGDQLRRGRFVAAARRGLVRSGGGAAILGEILDAALRQDGEFVVRLFRLGGVMSADQAEEALIDLGTGFKVGLSRTDRLELGDRLVDLLQADVKVGAARLIFEIFRGEGDGLVEGGEGLFLETEVAEDTADLVKAGRFLEGRSGRPRGILAQGGDGLIGASTLVEESGQLNGRGGLVGGLARDEGRIAQELFDEGIKVVGAGEIEDLATSCGVEGALIEESSETVSGGLASLGLEIDEGASQNETWNETERGSRAPGNEGVKGRGGGLVAVVAHLQLGEANAMIGVAGNALGKTGNGCLFLHRIGGQPVILGEIVEGALGGIFGVGFFGEAGLQLIEAVVALVDADEPGKKIGVVGTFEMEHGHGLARGGDGTLEVAGEFVEAVQLEQGIEPLPRIARPGELSEHADGGLGRARFEEEADDLGAEGDVSGRGLEQGIPIGDGFGGLSLEPVDRGLAQADHEPFLVRRGNDLDEPGVERERLGPAFLLIGDLGEGTQGGEARRIGLEGLIVKGAGRLGIAAFAEQVRVNQLRHGRSRFARSFEIIEEQGGLVFFRVEIPEQVEDLAVGGIFLEELDVVIGEPRIALGPGRGGRFFSRFLGWHGPRSGREKQSR